MRLLKAGVKDIFVREFLNDEDEGADEEDSDHDIYIMMQCLFVCL